MATKKPKKDAGKNKKLTLKKGTVRDLTARRDADDAVRGGAANGLSVRSNCEDCSY
jgi:hypothetical protein